MSAWTAGGSWDGQAPPTADIAFQNMIAGDFLSLAPFKDPSAINNNNLAVADGGIVTFDTLRRNVLADGLGEMASWRTNWPSDYRGDGTQGLVYRITPQQQADQPTMIWAFGVCDRGGDPTNALASAGYAGFFATVAPDRYWRVLRGDRTANLGNGIQAVPQGDSPSIYVWWMPAGKIGDDTQAGVADGRLGMFASFVRPNPLFGGAEVVGSPLTLTCRDGMYPLIAVGIGATGGANQNDVTAFQIERATFPCAPPGVFG